MLGFIMRLAEYCDMPQLYGCTMTSDNLGLIERIKDSGTVLYPAPPSRSHQTGTLSTNCQQNRNRMQTALDPKPTHSTRRKGHQDRDKPYYELDVISQLNVDVDREAVKFQENFSEIRPIVLRMPNNGAQLHLLCGTKGDTGSLRQNA
jgi:hypothetical protein